MSLNVYLTIFYALPELLPVPPGLVGGTSLVELTTTDSMFFFFIYFDISRSSSRLKYNSNLILF